MIPIAKQTKLILTLPLQVYHVKNKPCIKVHAPTKREAALRLTAIMRKRESRAFVFTAYLSWESKA
jgi:hypothetical protein